MTSEQACQLGADELASYSHGAGGLQKAVSILQRNVPEYILSAMGCHA
jgi:hypothetical protein